MTLEIRGLPELREACTDIADGLDDLTDGPNAAADAVAARAKALAPKLTGALARSIKGTGKPGAAAIGTPLRYGVPVHYGSPRRGIRGQPFLLNALQSVQAEVVTVWAKDVQKLLDKET